MRRFVMAAALAAAVITAGCQAGTGPQPAAPDAPVPVLHDQQPDVIIQDKPMPVATQLAGQTGVVEMAVTDHGFEPHALAAPIGGAVKIHLRNMGARPHNFILPQLGIVTGNLDPGGENYIEFPASQKGQWHFFSDAAGEEEAGLDGTLKVE